ncbi:MULTISPECIES: hypothetical protein [unclassified Streptomyces]|uniref:hypothetical protein n=1 Tax=unclassified Streptomyces TaxID=2593676 RepID=UPI002253C3DB|nr:MULTISPECIES: hypothetical protein [unclassified Streptomyces]WSP53162.1 hypothetical protein OG306_00995 [Streptomyces sp. NBC_01241]WSU26119.1 hypothetical protein OG508_38025 [Streptomyces sp. NBC_01108]MCX4799493.1 hypothetical protein [Streptomyces sp. NBC_01242]WSJ40683.1 hypothetical protein OG772_35255 [Streptomyces sp. NBC_01321]WSP67002.1 hypothetical protein OG466_38000 [Streptomyces sp. NBC_01240]
MFQQVVQLTALDGPGVVAPGPAGNAYVDDDADVGAGLLVLAIRTKLMEKIGIINGG